MLRTRISLPALIVLAATLPVCATEMMPDFASVPSGWVTDRYDPAAFENVGTYQGRDNVLGISISTADGLATRPAPYQSTFYNTQGRQHVITGAAGSSISADLYIPAAWRDAAHGSVRTDMWGVMTNGSAVSGYPIIGFTNYGGAARLRVWDGSVWNDLASQILYDSWNAMGITFTGSSYDFSVNGNLVFSNQLINGSTGFQAVIMQAYNFAGDPSIQGANAVDYTAHWSNHAVADSASTLALFGLGLVALVALRRRLS